MITINEQHAREAIAALEQQYNDLIAQIELRQKAAQQIPVLVAKANQAQGALGVWRVLLGVEPEVVEDADE